MDLILTIERHQTRHLVTLIFGGRAKKSIFDRDTFILSAWNVSIMAHIPQKGISFIFDPKILGSRPFLLGEMQEKRFSTVML